MTDAIDPKHLNLDSLLNKRLFRIPDYQRPYSWSARERKDLFADIDKIWYAEEEDSSHFMATVVCRKLGDVKVGIDVMSQLDIVDGQQRLTTLIILLNAIRYALDRDDDEQADAAKMLERLLVKPHGDRLLLLQTNHDTSHFFEDYMRKGKAATPRDAETLPDRNLLSAIEECKIFVKEWADDELLLGLAALVKNQLTFLLHVISDVRTVYTVFEALNSRGIPVSWLDRFKSILMGSAARVDEAQEELINDLHRIWADIYRALGLDDRLAAEALRFAATLYLPDQPSETLGQESAVERLRAIADDAKSIRDVANWLLTVVRSCVSVRSDPRRNAVTRYAQPRLLAVALRVRNFQHKGAELLEIWERVSFRIYGLHAKDARWGRGDYVRLAWEVANEEISASDTRSRLLEIGSEYPIETAIKVRPGEDCYRNWQHELRYLMYRYESHLAKQRKKKVDNVHWKSVWLEDAGDSIEHIRPQSEAPEKVKHTLGNLMLLPPSRNSQLQDRPPKDKAESYREVGFHHTKEVADMLEKSPRWSMEVCREREQKILDWMLDEWAD